MMGSSSQWSWQSPRWPEGFNTTVRQSISVQGNDEQLYIVHQSQKNFPHTIPTRSSFQPVPAGYPLPPYLAHGHAARIYHMVLLWLPALLPCTVSMGIKVTAAGLLFKTPGLYLAARILPVIMLLTIRIKSQASLFFCKRRTPLSSGMLFTGNHGSFILKVPPWPPAPLDIR